MPKYSTAFGMDVHLRSTTVCALDADTGEAVTRRFPGNPWGEIAGWMDGFPGPSLAAYESGYLWTVSRSCLVSLPYVSANLKLTTFANASRRMR